MITPHKKEGLKESYALEEALQNLEALSPDGGVYLHLLLEAIEMYANDPNYQKNPELVAKCFGPNGVDDDINEIIHHLSHDIAPLQRSKCLLAILELVKTNAVNRYFVSQICDYFDVRLEEEKDNPEERQVVRFYAPNLHFDAADEENFYRACGLSPIGGGNHIRWEDKSTGQLYGIESISSKKIWLKNDIKWLIASGFPIERIQAACQKLKIDFRILSK